MSSAEHSNLDRTLKALLEGCADLEALVRNGTTGLTAKEIGKVDAKLGRLADAVRNARHRMDPSKHEIIAISLGRPDALARFFAFSFVEREQELLAGISDAKFHGSGVYAIYYTGTGFPPYAPISGTETPIYVGKAVPRSPAAETASAQGLALWKRLREHHGSIVVGGLAPAEFRYRRAIIQSGMEGAVEDFMIRLFKPIWNKEIKLCYGIGKHGDAATTRRNKRSPWDTMHPGRGWAADTREDQRTMEEIVKAIAAHFASNPPITNKQRLHAMLALR